jgi:uncharacterized protein (TIGR03067 family)
MKHLAFWLLVFAHLPCSRAADATAEDKTLLNGKWKPIAAMLGGMKLPAEELKKVTLTIDGENYTVAIEGEPKADKGTAVQDNTVAPKRLTIKGTDGPNKGKTFLAIYEIKKVNGVDAYRVCYDLSGSAFPTEFESLTGTQLYLVGYRRK